MEAIRVHIVNFLLCQSLKNDVIGIPPPNSMLFFKEPEVASLIKLKTQCMLLPE